MERFLPKVFIAFLLCGILSPVCFALFQKSEPLPYYYDNPDAIKVKDEKPKEIKTNLYGNRIRPEDAEYKEPDLTLINNISEKDAGVTEIETNQIKKDKAYSKYLKRKNTMNRVDQKAPKMYEEYIEMSKEIKRADMEIKEPQFNKDEKLVNVPDPHLRVVPYNDPPGAYEFNLSELTKDRRINSIGVLSPDQSKLVYSCAYYYHTNKQISSEVYQVEVNPSFSTLDKIKYAHDVNKIQKPLLSTGTDYLQGTSLRTMTLVDWSSDSTKIAVKEKIGSSLEGIWQTNLYVYDFESKQEKKLNEIREAIRYYWKNNKNIDLVDFMWDIFPIGWDALNPDRIIVYAYAYTEAAPKFLGTWSIDAKGTRSQLLSLTDTNFAVSANGLRLKGIVRE